MIKIFKKYYKFSKKQQKNFNRSLWMSFLHSIFEALRIPAIAVILKAVTENNMTYNTLLLTVGIMGVSILGCFVTKHQMIMEQARGGYEMCAEKRIDIGEHMKFMPMGFFNTNSLGYLTSVTTNTVEQIQDVATRVIHLTLQGMITTVIIIISVTFFDYRIGLIAFGGLTLFLCANAIMQKVSVTLSHEKHREDERLVSEILEYIQGIAVVRSFNIDKDANKAVDQAIEDSEKITFKMEKKFVPLMGLHAFVLKLSGCMIVLASLYFYTTDTMSLLNTLLMIICSFMIFGQLEAVGSFSSLLRMIDLSVDKVNGVFEMPQMDVSGEAIEPSNFNIDVSNVTFSYEKKAIIKDVSFKIPEKKTTAIVGPSGGGKTTMIKLMSRFWDIDAGSIKIGGHELKDYTLESLLSHISMVFQDVYLFQDTIENNIKFGKADATREEVIEAAKKACCHEFIMALENGYDTVIGEGGASLSGGEKQRISIARALIKDAPIIMLDEATSNVDPENEALLQSAIEALTNNKTLIIIAHRLKTIENAHQILVMDDGRLVQQGHHRQLVAQAGIYKDFVDVRRTATSWKI